MGMAFRGNIWCFKDEPDTNPTDIAEPSFAASKTQYEHEMLTMVTTLLDHHHT